MNIILRYNVNKKASCFHLFLHHIPFHGKQILLHPMLRIPGKSEREGIFGLAHISYNLLSEMTKTTIKIPHLRWNLQHR